ncbi:MAG: class I SAM-dependent methyltransferase [Pedobacter sp.]
MSGALRRWEDIYDDLLRYQAELSCDLEQVFFRSSRAWADAKTILDFGAGNAYYSNLLARQYPDKNFICLERNIELAEIARRGITSNRIEVVTGSFDDLDSDRSFDFVFTRHALSYLSDAERYKFASWVSKNTSDHGAILIIDADDDAFFTSPRLPLLEGGNKKFQDDLKAEGGNRCLREVLPQYWLCNGFSHEFTRTLVVHSAISDRKYLMSMFMRSVAEIDHGSPLPNAVRDEIDSWAVDHSSYLQYGMFGTLFSKEGK